MIILIIHIINKTRHILKFSKIISLHKSAKLSSTERKSYRPVAILSPLSKIIEKAVYMQIYDYFTRNRILHPSLHGYRKNRSTQTALLEMYDRWVQAAHNGKLSGAVLLDLSAAFDLVSHNILIDKLKVYGLQNDILEWVQSYLTKRVQSVWIDHTFSSYLPCEVGVPQGSNLGPLFFLLFVNDLPFSLDCEMVQYADDSTLTASGKCVEEISDKLQTNCETVKLWMEKNKQKLNPEKTHIILLGTDQRLNISQGKLQV